MMMMMKMTDVRLSVLVVMWVNLAKFIVADTDNANYDVGLKARIYRKCKSSLAVFTHET